MKRKISPEFKARRREMRENLVECQDCTDYATELHHIVAVGDGGMDESDNLMPLCRSCHQEYTSGQTIERNVVGIKLSVETGGEVRAQIKGEKEFQSLGYIGELKNATTS